MLDLVKFLVTQIVDEPDAVKIDTAPDETGTTIISVTVAPQDMGKVIGRSGKIINAIRELVKVKAVKTNQRARVVLAEPPAAAGQVTQTDSLSPLPSTELPEQTS